MQQGPISDAIVWPSLPPGNLVCAALGFSDPMRVPVNSLVWMLLGVVALWIAA